jgi:hypothetical protein|tara:strand:- start:1 stop:384 length:384 start_codon:yes stop_codon:yes gene_type:complete
MAKFIKFNINTSILGGDASPITLIPIEHIVGVTEAAAGPEWNTVITLNSGNTWTIVSDQPLAVSSGGSGTITEAVYDAITANPGGIVSTVGSPILLAQVPAAQSGEQGRVVITQKQTQVQYISATFA